MLVSVEEFSYLADGHKKAEREKLELARWMCYNLLMMMPHGRNFHAPPSPEAYIPFSWDHEDAPKVASHVTDEETARLSAMYEEFMKRKMKR